MVDIKQDQLEPSQQLQAALSRWDTEGGAGVGGPQQEGSGRADRASDAPPLEHTELVQLRIRMIALENVMIGLLARASREQLDVVLGIAAHISPRPGFTQHPLTIHAATEMRNLVQRSAQFREQDDGIFASAPAPHKRTPVFDEHSLPAGPRNEHRTKPGVWGLIRVLEGQVRYQVLAPASEAILDADHPGLVSPDVPHRVEPLGHMRIRLCENSNGPC